MKDKSVSGGAGTNRTTVPSQLNGNNNVHDQSTHSMLLQDHPTTAAMTASQGAADPGYLGGSHSQHAIAHPSSLAAAGGSDAAEDQRSMFQMQI